MALVLGVAFIAGLVAHRLKLPVILGYLISGIIIGPHVLGLIDDVNAVQTMATIGVVLLMFTIGMEFSLKTLRLVGMFAIFGGLIQVIATVAFGFIIAWIFQKPLQEAILFGLFISLSSTTIVLKILMDRGEVSTSHGRVMISILLIQDLSVVPMMTIIPSLGDTGVSLLVDIAWGLLKASGFLVATFALGWWGFPWFMQKIVGVRSRELFLLAIVCISFGAGFAADRAGISIALGAFLAGLIISESDYAHQAIADIRPLRDTFAVLFFVSLGMLANPEFIKNNPWEVGIVVLAVVVGKFTIVAFITRGFGYGAKAALFAGGSLFQIGEFSFIIAAMALEMGHISNNLYDLTISVAFVTILLTPLGLGLMTHIYYRGLQSGRVDTLVDDQVSPEMLAAGTQKSGHVVFAAMAA